MSSPVPQAPKHGEVFSISPAPPGASWLARMVVAATLGLLLPIATTAQQPPSPEFLQGTHVFRRILFDMGFKPLEIDAELLEKPANSILIVLGADHRLGMPILPYRDGWVRDFVNDGGAVLCASDQAITRPAMPPPDLGGVPFGIGRPGRFRHEVSRLTGFKISGQLVQFPKQDDEARYNNSPYCPILHLKPNVRGTNPPDLFHNPQGDRPFLKVVTNLPSTLEKIRSWQPPAGIYELATLPLGCATYAPDENQGRGENPRVLGENELLCVVGGQVGTGRVLMIADHSIFINALMMRSDNGNVEFTANCLDYLRGPDRRRDQVLLVDEGKVESDFKVPLKEIPGITDQELAALLANVDNILAQLENKNAFNQLLLEWFRYLGVQPWMVWRAVIALLSLALLAYACRRLLRAQGYRPEPGLPLLDQAVTPTSPPESLLQQRQQAMLQLGNLWESARLLARQVFAGAGVTGPRLTATRGGARARPPRIAVRGGVWRRWRRGRQVLRLWRLAFGRVPGRVRPADWQRLVGELERLRVDLANGSVQVGQPA